MEGPEVAIETKIEIVSWVITIVLLYIFVPKHKYREAHVSFLFMQALTWVFGAVVVELHLIAYPVRFFHYAFRSSFTFEYFIFPAVSVLFNVHFPKEGIYIKKHYIPLFFHLYLRLVKFCLKSIQITLSILNGIGFGAG
jgi:hypothetical protein